MATTTNNGWETPDDTDLVKDGALAMRTLGNAIDTSVGTGLLAWTSYTPTLGNITLGNGAINAAYVQLGKTVHVRFRLIWGSTSSMGAGQPKSFTLPVQIKGSTYSTYDVIGVGTANYPGITPLVPMILSAGSVMIAAQGTTGTYISTVDLTSTIPFTWTATNSLSINLTYEAA